MATYIVSAARTPIGSLLGSLSSLSAVELGAHAVKAALARAPQLDPSRVDEIYIGNVLSAGLGQAPARQIGLAAGLPHSLVATTVNKVCSSGLKSVMLGAQTIELGQAQCVVVGGAESMSNVPHYLPGLRRGVKYGSGKFVDGLEFDGLTDAYDKVAMGFAAEDCAAEFGITREEQDEFAVASYKRAQGASAAGKFAEIAPVEVPASRRGQPPKTIDTDEEIANFDEARVATSRPAFMKNEGTVTAVNSSKLNDGAAALILASEGLVKELNLEPLAVIRGYADAAKSPIKFPSAPGLAVQKLLDKQGLATTQIDYFEFNEAFSVVGVANSRILQLDPERVNVYGGAVSLGHPLGCSGARILATLTSVLRQEKGRLGVAAICNGGGGASAMLIERV